MRQTVTALRLQRDQVYGRRAICNPNQQQSLPNDCLCNRHYSSPLKKTVYLLKKALPWKIKTPSISDRTLIPNLLHVFYIISLLATEHIYNMTAGIPRVTCKRTIRTPPFCLIMEDFVFMSPVNIFKPQWMRGV